MDLSNIVGDYKIIKDFEVVVKGGIGINVRPGRHENHSFLEYGDTVFFYKGDYLSIEEVNSSRSDTLTIHFISMRNEVISTAIFRLLPDDSLDFIKDYIDSYLILDS